MAKHQIIYTSCMRGIDGVNDGQQIFSYDEDFKECKTDEVKSLFTYQVPSLPSGVLMNEEIAKTMPSSFMYRWLKNGMVSLTLNTYIGRDYMGSAGRFGNHLSHSIVCDFDDFNIYPCEMHQSVALRKSMEYSEVNNPEIPSYLPIPDLIKGYEIDPNMIIDFLGIDDNLEYYKKMVVAMLKFPTEKKRVVICDTPEKVVKWIAALHYVLPIDMAKKVNFTTYEYDPELSPAQICGVIADGTRYNAANYIKSNRYYVFDFINKQFSNVDVNNVFIDFVDAAFSFSYESLLEFHEFVISKTSYRGCDENYYAAYYLYSLISEGISEITKDEFGAIVEFVHKYMEDDIIKEVVDKIIEEKTTIDQLDNIYAFDLLGFMIKSIERLDDAQQNVVKQMLVDRLIFILSTVGMDEETFTSLYNKIDDMMRNVNLNLQTELMEDCNRDSLLSVISKSGDLWKIRFIVRIISEYVKDVRISVDELYPNCSIGAVYYGIVQKSYKNGPTSGQDIVETILAEFKTNANYFVNMALNIEGYLNDLAISSSDLENLWNYFSKSALVMTKEAIDEINHCLEEYERYDEMYLLYENKIHTFASFDDIREFVMEYWNKWIKNSGYGSSYGAQILKKYEELYERKMMSLPEKQQFLYACEILDIAMQMKIKEEFVDHLSMAVCEFIPMTKLSSENTKMIDDIYHYRTEVLQKKIDGKLLLFVIATKFNRILSRASLTTTVKDIISISPETGASLNGLDDGKVESYFEWVFASVSELSLKTDDLDKIYGLFQFKKRAQSIFMEYWCKVTYKNSKDNKDYADFAEFLSFMFSLGSLDEQEMVGKYLCKLSKQKLEELDEEMKLYFKRDRKATHAWERIRETASKTNPLLNNLSNLFKRK